MQHGAGDRRTDAVVVGAGPNGLAAAIVLAEAGLSVAVLEAADTVGGGVRSDELTLPGFVHDTCSTVQVMSLLSPFLRRLPLGEHGLELVHGMCGYFAGRAALRGIRRHTRT
jgi:phytoene dehydrogenase-like protein